MLYYASIDLKLLLQAINVCCDTIRLQQLLHAMLTPLLLLHCFNGCSCRSSDELVRGLQQPMLGLYIIQQRSADSQKTSVNQGTISSPNTCNSQLYLLADAAYIITRNCKNYPLNYLNYYYALKRIRCQQIAYCVQWPCRHCPSFCDWAACQTRVVDTR